MLIFRSESLSRDCENYDRAQAKALEKLPRCSECDRPIQDDFCFEINGELLCGECLNDNHRKSTEYFIE